MIDGHFYPLLRSAIHCMHNVLSCAFKFIIVRGKNKIINYKFSSSFIMQLVHKTCTQATQNSENLVSEEKKANLSLLSRKDLRYFIIVCVQTG